jgi:hypothetical protein
VLFALPGGKDPDSAIVRHPAAYTRNCFTEATYVTTPILRAQDGYVTAEENFPR